MYDGETEPIPRVTDRDEPDLHVGHGHGHGHTPAEPVSRRVRTIIAVLLVPFALAAAVGVVLLYPFGDHPQAKSGAGTPVNGVITAAESGACNGDVQVGDQGGGGKCLIVRVRMTDGDAPNTEIRTVVPLEPSTPRFTVDDKVVLAYAGGNPTDGASYQLVDFQRDVPLVLLAGLFAIAVLVLGRWQGLKALAALVISFVVLVFFVLPAILAGENPLLVAVVGAGVIMFVVLYLTHGLSARTSTAVLGTMVSLTLIGVLGALWAAFADLTGLDEDTATLVGLLNKPIDTRGLLLAGVVIGALGVLDDVTVTQTSAVWELRAANPSLTRRQLYAAALRIGRDHVASAVNTLVMAYAGAALPLLLYSSISGVGIGHILTSQSIAQEIVRTLVGSIGIVAAVPLTSALAAAVAAQEPMGSEVAPRKGSSGDGARGRKVAGERGGRDRERRTARERVGDREQAGDRGRGRGAARKLTGSREASGDRDGELAGSREREGDSDRGASRGRNGERERATSRGWDGDSDRATSRGRDGEKGRAAPRGQDGEPDRATSRRRDGESDRAVSRGHDGEPDRGTSRRHNGESDRAVSRGHNGEPDRVTSRGYDDEPDPVASRGRHGEKERASRGRDGESDRATSRRRDGERGRSAEHDGLRESAGDQAGVRSRASRLERAADRDRAVGRDRVGERERVGERDPGGRGAERDRGAGRERAGREEAGERDSSDHAGRHDQVRQRGRRLRESWDEQDDVAERRPRPQRPTRQD